MTVTGPDTTDTGTVGLTIYERRCRALLRAFPTDYRSERGDEIVGVLLDTAEPARRWPSARTTADLVSAGLQARSKASTQGRASLTVVEGFRMAALLGLCVQVAFSLSMIIHRRRDGLLFYLPNNGWSPAALGLLSAIWVVAFLLVLAGWPRLAAIPVVIGGAGSVITFFGNFAGSLRHVQSSSLLIALQMTLLGVVPALALVVAAIRPARNARRSALWLVACAALTAMFSTLRSGITITSDGERHLSFPPSGSLVMFLFWICLAALFVMLVASTLDPRFGVGIIVASLPIVVYQVGLVVTAEPKPALPVLLAMAAFATCVVGALRSAVSLRRQRA